MYAQIGTNSSVGGITHLDANYTTQRVNYTGSATHSNAHQQQQLCKYQWFKDLF